jgi:hypothetical protein
MWFAGAGASPTSMTHHVPRALMPHVPVQLAEAALGAMTSHALEPYWRYAIQRYAI